MSWSGGTSTRAGVPNHPWRNRNIDGARPCPGLARPQSPLERSQRRHAGVRAGDAPVPNHPWRERNGTYPPAGEGRFLYLSIVLDLCLRWSAGWSIADHMRTGLVSDALRAAAVTRGSLDGAIFYSDHGAHCTSAGFVKVCAELGVRQPMSAAGSSAGNATTEAFNAGLAREALQGAERWSSAREAHLAVFKWITRCNTRRPHSTLGHLSPIECEQQAIDEVLLAV